jgi:hypothetical protein
VIQNITFSDNSSRIEEGKMDIEKICLGCKSSNIETVGQHPYFEGSLCKNCMVRDILFIWHGPILTSLYNIFFYKGVINQIFPINPGM